MQRRKSCGIVPVYQGDTRTEFLIIHQTNDIWGFPKGGEEAGESEVDTARRELAEETNITDVEFLANTKIYERYDAIYPDGQSYHKEVAYFVGIVSNQAVTLQEEEVQDYAWLPYEEALERLTFENTQKVLRQAYAALKERQ